MHKLIAAAAACAILAAAAAPAEAGKLEDVLSRGKLVVGTGSTNPPWHFKDAEDKLVGFDIDIAKMVAKGLFGDPEKVEFVTQTSDARIPNITTDRVDITCQFMTVTAERAQQVDFTVRYYREGVGLLLLKGGKYADYAALKAAKSDVVVAALQNVYAEAMVHEALPEAKVDQYESVDLAYQALNSGRADAVATDMSSVRWLIAQEPDRYLDAGFGWGPQSYGCAVKKGDPEWLQFVDTVLLEAMTGVEFKAYSDSFEHWFGEKPPAPPIGFPAELR